MRKQEIISKLLFLMLFLLLLTGFSSTRTTNFELTKIDDFYSVIKTTEWRQAPKAERMEAVDLSKHEVERLEFQEFYYALIEYPFVTDFIVQSGYDKIPTHLLQGSNVFSRLFMETDKPLDEIIDFYHSGFYQNLIEDDEEKRAIYNTVQSNLLLRPELTAKSSDEAAKLGKELAYKITREFYEPVDSGSAALLNKNPIEFSRRMAFSYQRIDEIL